VSDMLTVGYVSVGPLQGRSAVEEFPHDRQEAQALNKVGAKLYNIRGETEDRLIELLQDTDGILVGGGGDQYVSRYVIENVPRVKAIVRYGIGVDNIDVQAATEQGIVVVNAPDFCIEEVANHTMMLLLASAKKLTLFHNEMRKGNWDRSLLAPMPSIYGQTLGLIGFGNIARSVARKAKAFNLRLMAYDPYVSMADAWERGVDLLRGDLPRLLRHADYVSVHCPLVDETRHLLGREEFKIMKPSAFVINTARGPVLDEAALIEALQEGSIAGAGLDVFDKEPLSAESPLLQMDNVIVLPHTGGYSDVGYLALQRRVGEEMGRVLTGQWPLCPVNPHVEPRVPLK
jgi:D-3-phosphoglycerate dehydrogenase